MRKVLQRVAASAGQLVGAAPERDVFIRYPKPAQGIPNCLGEGGFAPFLVQVGPETKNKHLVIHSNSIGSHTQCRALLVGVRRRRFIQISALSTFDGRIEAYHGRNG
jgi:hypothetical protein